MHKKSYKWQQQQNDKGHFKSAGDFEKEIKQWWGLLRSATLNFSCNGIVNTNSFLLNLKDIYHDELDYLSSRVLYNFGPTH